MSLTIGLRFESGLACFALVGNLTLPGPRSDSRRPSPWQRLKRELQDAWADLQQGIQEAWTIGEIAASALAFGFNLSQTRSRA